MVKTLSVLLDWEGPYTDPSPIPTKAGIYMVLSGKQDAQGNWNTNSYKLLDIGQTGEGADRLATHEREECWKRNKSDGSTILFKFAAMPSKNYDVTDRQIVECCLRSHIKPLCGTECNAGYNKDASVTIKNTGRPAPLNENYSCKP